MELTVVVALIATLSVLALPRLSSFLNPDVEKDVQRELENVLLAVRNEAILGRQTLALLYDLGENTFQMARFSKDGEVEPAEDSRSLYRRLPKGIRFMDIVTTRDGKVAQGTGFTIVRPNGWVEPTILHVQDVKGRTFSIRLRPLSGMTRLEEGYVELKEVAL
jgi:type II secretory pathway pseudopilin PulG